MSNTEHAIATKTVATVAAELAAVDAQILHLEWFVKSAPSFVDRSAEISKLDTLRYQTRGNLLVDLRAAMAVLA